VPGTRIDAKVLVRGGIFNNPGTKFQVLKEQLDYTLAQAGKDMVLARLGRVLKDRTGRYEAKVQTERVSTGWEVNDGRKELYGPWLEGTGSRNRTTRFKGYRTFRLVRQELGGKSKEIAKPIIAKFLRDMS
jgi:hypothetical protein